MLKDIQAEFHHENVQKFIRKFQADYHIPTFLKPDEIDPEIVATDIRLWGRIKKAAKNSPKILKSGLRMKEHNQIRERILKKNRPKYGFEPMTKFPSPMELFKKELKQKGEFQTKVFLTLELEEIIGPNFMR